MDKIVLYGAGAIFRYFEKIFWELQEENKIQILGVADRKLNEPTFHNFKVFSLSEMVNLSVDYIIITAEGVAAEGICADLCANGIPNKKIIGVYNYAFVKEKLNILDSNQLSVQLGIIKKILSASDSDVGNLEWMRNIVGQYGIFPFLEDDLRGTGNVMFTHIGMLQRPNEFAEYCVYLSNLNIGTAIEVGVFHGKSSYFMCALLARKNPNLVYELVDIYDNLDNFEEFHELLPQMRKRIPATSDDLAGKTYDFVFIDADHSYDASMRDYMNLGRYAKKLTVFHDIFSHEYDNQNGGTVRMWNEVVNMTSEHKHHVFSEYQGKWMGIGVLEYAK